MSRQSSGSNCRARRVESTRSQNSTVSCRRSASGTCGVATDGAVWTACAVRRVGRGLCLGEARSGLRRRRAPSPDQDSALLVTGQLFGRDDFVFQVFEVVVVQVEAAFEGPVRHPPLTPEQVKHLGQEFIKGHD